MSEVVAEIKADTENPHTTTWKKGLVVDASGGIKWTGSASTGFKLTTETYNATSEGDLNIQNVIDHLQKMEADIKAGRLSTPESALVFDYSPEGNGSALLRGLVSSFLNSDY